MERTSSHWQDTDMGLIEIIIVLLVLLWLFGAFIVPVGGAFIHLLLVIAVIVLIIRIVQGRRVL
jgi:Family of unknown function (DUF5670)